MLRVGCVALTLPDLGNANVGVYLSEVFFGASPLLAAHFCILRTKMEALLNNLREKKPLIHCITNYVTANDVANALLAIGGAPVMADSEAEAEDITSISAALYINTGTLNDMRQAAMLRAGRAANAAGIPALLDPVGAGASRGRTDAVKKLIYAVKFAVIRGNASEIAAISGAGGFTKGVDAAPDDSLPVDSARAVAADTKSVVVMSGKTDVVTDGRRCVFVKNGSELMSRVTGTGCVLSAIVAAFVAANPENTFDAAVAAVCAMGLAGQKAAERMSGADGSFSYRGYMIDALYNMSGRTLEKEARYEIV